MKKASPAAARRYARALLDVARQAGDPASLREELRSVRGVLESQPRLLELLGSPALAPEAKRRILSAVFAQVAAKPLLRLLELLTERRRVELLPGIEAAYAALWNAERGVAAAEAVSALPLDDAQRAALEAALRRLTGLGIELSLRQDPALLGGLLVNLAGRSYDGSVRARLRALRERLTA
jgi:F-type H+-transporting ATPase subunit delta